MRTMPLGRGSLTGAIHPRFADLRGAHGYSNPAPTRRRGCVSKARIARHVLGEETDGTYEDHLVRSILGDLTA